MNSAPNHDLVTREQIAERLSEVHQRIEAAGGQIEGSDRVQIVAVTKTFPIQLVRAAFAAGLRDLGENYAQELQGKAPEVEDLDDVRWHFIGGLQTNKVRKVAPYVSLWQTVDRTGLALELSKRVPGAEVLIQVNTTGEPQKSGVEPGEVSKLVSLANDLGLLVSGLMTVGPTSAEVDPRPGFATCRSLADGLGLKVVSMGMTGDYELAIAEGSTMVRIGSALFGHRHAP
jgi:pyridoxal phosphate enzyme (YggS family)